MIDPASPQPEENEAAEGQAHEAKEKAVEKTKTCDYWLRWVRACKKAASRHWQDSLEAWREYEKDVNDNITNQYRSSRDQINVYPVYNSICQSLFPAHFARPPVLTTERLFSINDDVANTGCLILERLGKHLMLTSNFTEVMNYSVANFFHSAKATNQVIYEAEIVKGKKRVQAYPAGDGTAYVDETGAPITGEIKQDEQGIFSEIEIDQADEDSQRIKLAPVPYDEVLHTPNANTNEDIKEIAFYFTCTKEEAEKKFSPEVLSVIQWKKGAAKSSDTDALDNSEMQDSPDYYMDGWEIYCKETEYVYWVSEMYPHGFLKDPEKDPYGFQDFFPCPPFIIQNKPRKNLYPRPMYVFLRPSLMQLHLMYDRVFGLIDSVRRRAIVDGEDDVISALNAGDQEFVSAKSLKNIIEKGGLDSMIWYIPVQELVNAISELNALEDRFTANVEKWAGLPDILQGQSDPIEALGTQEIKASAAHDRFKINKYQVQKLARDSIELMIDLALKVFSDEKIARITGLQYMSPEDQQRFLPALQMLRNDEERVIRIDIETDSLVFVDQGLKAQRRNVAIQSALNGLEKVVAMSQTNPALASVAMKAVLLSLEGLEDGKQYQDQIKAIGLELEQAAANPPPQPPPPPDYEAEKLALQHQQLQLDAQKTQADEQRKNVELQQTQEALQFNQSLEQQRLALEARKIELEAEYKSLSLQLAGAETASTARLSKTDQELKTLKQTADTSLEQQRLELDKVTKGLEIKEKFLEEQRLKLEQRP